MRQMVICFVAREDFTSKPGGDTIQWQIYDTAAKAAGMKTAAWFDDAPMPDADLFHALNVDRPLEVYPKMREVQRRGRKFVLSTIHHPSPWIERFRKEEPPGGSIGRLLYRSPLGRTVPGSESVKEVARLLKQKRLTHLRDLWPCWSARVRWLLDHAQKIMLLARDEEHYLRSDFGAQFAAAGAVIVPNWVEGVGGNAFSARDELLKQWPEPPVLVVGRIEARKNVRRVALAAERAQRPTLFLGKPNPNEPAYVRDFQETIENSRFVRWVAGVPRAELSGYYRAAGFLLNASYVEVSPMVDIEALLLGCPVATTRYALHHALLPPETPLCDPYDDTGLVRILQWRPERMEPTCVADPDKCRNTLLSVYQELVGGRG